jgi:hypothetical protein
MGANVSGARARARRVRECRRGLPLHSFSPSACRVLLEKTKSGALNPLAPQPLISLFHLARRRHPVPTTIQAAQGRRRPGVVLDQPPLRPARPPKVGLEGRPKRALGGLELGAGEGQAGVFRRAGGFQLFFECLGGMGGGRRVCEGKKEREGERRASECLGRGGAKGHASVFSFFVFFSFD